jgi:hypothetical protein
MEEVDSNELKRTTLWHLIIQLYVIKYFTAINMIREKLFFLKSWSVRSQRSRGQCYQQAQASANRSALQRGCKLSCLHVPTAPSHSSVRASYPFKSCGKVSETGPLSPILVETQEKLTVRHALMSTTHFQTGYSHFGSI